jgi:hypothetical protein
VVADRAGGPAGGRLFRLLRQLCLIEPSASAQARGTSQARGRATEAHIRNKETLSQAPVSQATVNHESWNIRDPHFHIGPIRRRSASVSFCGLFFCAYLRTLARRASRRRCHPAGILGGLLRDRRYAAAGSAVGSVPDSLGRGRGLRRPRWFSFRGCLTGRVRGP